MSIQSFSKECRFLFCSVLFCTLWLLFDQDSFVGETLGNFRFQYLLLTPLGFFGWRSYRLLVGGLMLLCAVSNSLAIVRARVATSSSTSAHHSVTESSYRVLSANLFGALNTTGSIGRLITSTSPDILVLQEYREEFAGLELFKDYPRSVVRPRENDFGIAIYSRFPLTDRTGDLAQRFELNIAAEVQSGNRSRTSL